jgi:glycosyltransferase involved in cell wall biosynthesis
LIKEATQLGIIEEKGYVTDDMLIALIKNSIALVYPSKYEGFGLPPLEAMSLGCPIITSRQTSLPEICGAAAYYIDPDNEYEFAKAIIELENNADLRNRLSELGLNQSKRYSWYSSAKLFFKHIINLYDKKRK